MAAPSPTTDEKAYLLAELRVLSARLRADVLELDTIGVGLAGNLLDVDAALRWLKDLGYHTALGIYRHGNGGIDAFNKAFYKSEAAGTVLRGQEQSRGAGADGDLAVGGEQDDERGSRREVAENGA